MTNRHGICSEVFLYPLGGIIVAKSLVSDALWRRIEPLFPSPLPRRTRFPGRKPLDHRKILTGIVSQASVAGDVAGAMVLANRPDSIPTLKTITVPTLILEGLEDTVYPPEFSMKMQQNIAGSKLVIVPGAAHAAIFEKASAMNAAIITWARTIR